MLWLLKALWKYYNQSTSRTKLPWRKWGRVWGPRPSVWDGLAQLPCGGPGLDECNSSKAHPSRRCGSHLSILASKGLKALRHLSGRLYLDNHWSRDQDLTLLAAGLLAPLFHSLPARWMLSCNRCAKVTGPPWSLKGSLLSHPQVAHFKSIGQTERHLPHCQGLVHKI